MYDKSLATRPLIDRNELESNIEKLRSRMITLMERTGWSAHASPHEIVGDIDEEFLEFREAVRSGSTLSQSEELLDIATAALWGFIGISSRKVRQ